MALHLHRAERTDLLADGLGALLSDPLSDPFAEEVVIVPAKGVERWLSQRLSHVLGRGARCRRGVRRHRLPQPALADRRNQRHRPRRSVVTGRDGLAAARPRSTTARPDLVQDAGHPPGPLRDRVTSANCGKVGAMPSPDDSPGSSRPTPANGRNCSSTGESGADGDVDSDLLWQPPLWRALVDRIDAETPHSRHAKTRCQASGVRHRAAGAHFAVRPYPAAEHRDRTARRAGHPPRPSPVAAAPQRRAVDVALPTIADPILRRDDTSHRRSTIRCWPRSVVICANCSAVCPPTRIPTNTSAATPIPRPCSAGCSPISPPMPFARKAGRSRPTTARCRCTAATAPPVRSTSCAKCCSAFSPTTPPSNPATSSSCARTSRPTHR